MIHEQHLPGFRQYLSLADEAKQHTIERLTVAHLADVQSAELLYVTNYALTLASDFDALDRQNDTLRGLVTQLITIVQTVLTEFACTESEVARWQQTIDEARAVLDGEVVE